MLTYILTRLSLKCFPMIQNNSIYSHCIYFIATCPKTTNSDAPEVTEALASTSLSTGGDAAVATVGTSGEGISGTEGTNPASSPSSEQWDDEALAAKIAPKTDGSGGAGATELLDMKALKKKRNEEDDIAERMRVEETKAKLAAAKEGMAKEAERLREEKEAKTSGGGGGGGGGGGRCCWCQCWRCWRGRAEVWSSRRIDGNWRACRNGRWEQQVGTASSARRGRFVHPWTCHDGRRSRSRSRSR